MNYLEDELYDLKVTLKEIVTFKTGYFENNQWFEMGSNLEIIGKVEVLE